MQISNDNKIREGGPPGIKQPSKSAPIVHITNEGEIRIKNYHLFFKVTIENGLFIKPADLEAYEGLRDDYFYTRSSIAEYLKLQGEPSDEEIIQQLKDRYFYIKDTENISDEFHKERKQQAQNLIRQLQQSKAIYMRVSIFQGNLYSIAEDLIKKQDYKNARIALAISHVYSFMHGSCYVTTKEQYAFQMKLLPDFVKNLYLQRTAPLLSKGKEYEKLKIKLLELLEQK